MKVLIIIDNLGSGGAQRQVTLLALGLSKRGYKVDIFYYYPHFFYNELREDENINLIFVPKKNRLGLNVIYVLTTQILKEKYSTIISFLSTPNFYAAVAKRLSFTKSKLITSERSSTNFENFSLKLILKKWSHNQARYLITNSYHERKNWLTQFPQWGNKLVTIYNSVDTFVFQPQTFRKEKFANKLLAIGSISSSKNGLCLIKAMGILKRSHNLHFKLVWIGEQVLHIPERKLYLDLMLKAIVEENIESHWEWVKPKKNILNYYYSSDALVLPSIIEGLPNVVCEALSCGLPIIISNVLDHPILCDYGNNGLLFNPHDPNDLAEKLILFYSNESYLLGDKIHQFAINHFSYDFFISRFESLIQ